MSLWSRWVAVLDRRETGESLALIRILLGAVVLFVLWRDLTAVEPFWLHIDHGGYRALDNPRWIITALGGCTPQVIHGLMGTCAVGAVMIVIGLLPRLAALVCLQILLALTEINSHTSGSDDLLLANALWLLVLSNSAATWSVWCRIQTGSWRSDRMVTAWPRYLFIGQLVILYGMTGLQKVSAHWVPGGDLGALYYILQQPAWMRQDLPWLADVYGLTQLATLSTWTFEVGAPVLLLAYWFRATRQRGGRLRALFNRLNFRTLFAFAGVGLHIGIHTAMDIGPFSLITLSMYPALWHPDEWRQKLRGSTGPQRQSAPSSPPGTPAPPAE
ncbi:MAG: hypothetical protein ACI8RZ_001009 [Myxococcota bacterium]|jgi:hypothetical protein